ncbi:hypothetical protein [Pseudomonas sp. SMN5]|uniref:hypothetical protein n=1 Tax=Pseudomonas sp. SMN5 TaxID=3390198 RepID=UPI003F876343
MDCNTRTVPIVFDFETVAIRKGGLGLGKCDVSGGQKPEKRLNFLSDLCLVFGAKPYM